MKFKYWGKDTVLLHERGIRERTGDFSVLMGASVRERFFVDLKQIMGEVDFKVVAALIDKHRLPSDYWKRTPYDVATQFALEWIFYEMQSCNQVGSQIPIVFESRGGKEDAALMAVTKKICTDTELRGMPGMFQCCCISKLANSVGLQLADLIARPIGNHYLHPDSSDHSWDIIDGKMRRSNEGRLEGYGLKMYPSSVDGYTLAKIWERGENQH